MELKKCNQNELETLLIELPVEVVSTNLELVYEEPFFMVWLNIEIYWEKENESETLYEKYELSTNKPKDIAKDIYDYIVNKFIERNYDE